MQRTSRFFSLRFSIFARAFCSNVANASSDSVVGIASASASVSECGEAEILVKGMGCNRKAILNRPSSLNALSSSMVSRLRKLYQAWEDDAEIGFVVLKSAGERAFCTGGDVVNIYKLGQKGKLEECQDFFRKAYGLVYFVGTYMKPHVALLNGMTMGGGAGISIPGTFRVATEKSVFAMPETQIGFIPDAGGSFFLSHLPGHLGEYLSLTGARLNGAEMLASGLATHFALSPRLNWIEERLATLVTDDPSVLEAALDEYSDTVLPDKKSALQRMDAIDRCFSKESVEEILSALQVEAARHNDDWYTDTIEKIKEASPISLKVTLKAIREGRYQSLDQCLIREYRVTCHALSRKISGDFFEGIRSRLIEKDYNPKWDPPSLEQVTKDAVDQYFLPLHEAGGVDLELPVKQREAYV